MAQRFTCGLIATYPIGQPGNRYYSPGRFYFRWLVEWLTRCVGWTLVDKSTLGSSNWDNVAASGATCVTTAFNRVNITSVGYAFSNSDIGGYLTLTGFSNGTRDGIYRIRKFLGNIGSVYTLDIETEFGVHSDGLPVGDTVPWRLFFANDTYCPSTNSDWAVVGGTGTTGAGLTNGTGTGVQLDVSGTTVTLTKATDAVSFQVSDIGKDVIIAGATTPAHDGRFTILSRPSATQITYTNAAGGLPASEGFSGTWSIRYTYHVHLRPNTILGSIYSAPSVGFGEFRISPFAVWDAVNHRWTTGDSRYTAAWDGGQGSGDTFDPDSTRYLAIYAEGDLDHFTTVAIAVRGAYYHAVESIHVGELDAFYPDLDPRPCYLWCGTSFRSLYAGGWNPGEPVIGPLSISASGATEHWPDGFRGLGYDDTTTLTYTAMLPVQMPNSDPGWALQIGTHRKLSTRSRMLYRFPIILESRSSGYMELRGTTRQIWSCANTIPLGYQQGASGEYISVLRGVLMPWNNSRNAMEEIGYVPGGCA